MKTIDLPDQSDNQQSWPMLRAMVGIGIVCALLIVGVFQITAAPILHNQAKLLDKAVVSIFPKAASKRAYIETSTGDLQQQGAGQTFEAPVYAVIDAQQQLLGFAIKAQGMGYQDTIRFLYGYAPEDEAIIGIKILASRETPGLGDRISKDNDFLKNFVRLSVALSADKRQIVNPIESVKAGSKTQAWQIDSISGATISSRAVADILAASSSFWIPKLAQHQRQRDE